MLHVLLPYISTNYFNSLFIEKIISYLSVSYHPEETVLPEGLHQMVDKKSKLWNMYFVHSFHNFRYSIVKIYYYNVSHANYISKRSGKET